MPATALSFRIHEAYGVSPGITEAVRRLLAQASGGYIARSPESQQILLGRYLDGGPPNSLLVARLGDDADGLIVGLAYMAKLRTLDDRRLVVVQDLVVDQHYRRQGVGRQLFEHLLKDIAHSGGGRVILGCKDLGGDIPDYAVERLLATEWITITEGDEPLAGEVPRSGLF